MENKEMKQALQGIMAEDRNSIPRTSNPICNTCKHHNRGTITCKAFPNGIPKEILTRKADHKKPYEGDNGIMYTPREVH